MDSLINEDPKVHDQDLAYKLKYKEKQKRIIIFS